MGNRLRRHLLHTAIAATIVAVAAAVGFASLSIVLWSGSGLSSQFRAPVSEIQSIEGVCVGVLDGDTVTVLDGNNTQHRIRLLGIDAPEKAQAFGQESKKHLSDLIFRRTVLVQSYGLDPYGRTLGKILVIQNNQPVDANLEQVRAGLAWWYEAFRRSQSLEDQRLYRAAELSARRDRVGLWAAPSPTPPWDYRKLPSR